MTLVPAYGRDYKSKKAVQADMDAGKDFFICDMSHPSDGKPTNKDTLWDEGHFVVQVRYNKLRKSANIEVR